MLSRTMNFSKDKTVSIKNEKTIYYFNALLIAIFIGSLVLSIENKIMQFWNLPENYCDVVGVSSQIITTILSLIVSVIGIAISLQNESFFGVRSTKIYALRKAKHYSILNIILISIFICAFNLAFYMLDLTIAAIGTLLVAVLFSVKVTCLEIPLMTKKEEAFFGIIKDDLIYCYLNKKEINHDVQTVIKHVLSEKNLSELYSILKDDKDDKYNSFLMLQLLDIQCHFAFELKMYSDEGQLYKIGDSLLGNVFDVVLRHFEFSDEIFSEIEKNKHLLTRVLFRLNNLSIVKPLLTSKIDSLFQVLLYCSSTNPGDKLLSSIIIILIANTIKQGDFAIIKAVRKCLSHSFWDVTDTCSATSVFAVISMQMYYLCELEKDTPENIKKEIVDFINESGEIVEETKIISWKKLYSSFAENFNVDYSYFLELAESNIHILEYWLLGSHAKTVVLDTNFFTKWYLTNLINTGKLVDKELNSLLSTNPDMKYYLKSFGDECLNDNGEFSPSEEMYRMISFYCDSKQSFGLFNIYEKRNKTLFEIINRIRKDEIKKKARQAKEVKNEDLAQSIEKSICSAVSKEWGYNASLKVVNSQRVFSVLLEKTTDAINFNEFLTNYCVESVLKDIRKSIEFKNVYGGENFEKELDNILDKNIKYVTASVKNTIPYFYISNEQLKEKFKQVCEPLEEIKSNLLGVEILVTDLGFNFNCVVDEVEVRELTEEELSEKVNGYQRSDGQYIFRGAFMPREEILEIIKDRFIVLTVIFKHQIISSKDTVFNLLPFINEEDVENDTNYATLQ